jgi:DNA ligase-1
MFSKQMFGLNKDKSYKVWGVTAKQYICHVEQVERNVLAIKHGKENGKLTEKLEFFTEGKQGRSAYQQAVFEAESRIKIQLDKGYRFSKEELDELPILAMLAKDHTKAGKDSDIENGVFTSDKLDGIRLMAVCKLVGDVKEVSLQSRTGQAISIPHIEAQLLEVMNPGEVFDGEAFLYGPVLQDINSAVQRTDPQAKIKEAEKKLAVAINKGLAASDPQKYLGLVGELNNAHAIADLRSKLEFHVFDVAQLEVPFDERLSTLKEIGQRFEGYPSLVEVKYRTAYSVEDLTSQLKDCISRGYEGIMYRLPGGLYESGKRSSGLFKYKLMFDSEFQILDVVKDKQGNAVFVLQNDLAPNTFSCVMGDMQFRKEALENKGDYIGKWMTVSYQARYKDSLICQFPAGKVIREGSVINGAFTPSM